MHWAVEILLQDRPVDLAQRSFCLGVFHARDYPLRMEKIIYRSAFTKKLGIGSNGETGLTVPPIYREKVLEFLSG